MSQNLEQLGKKLAEKQKEIILLKNKIDDIENKMLVPELKKRYVGKYFKYRNNYSCPQTEKDYWWLYSQVIGVIGKDQCIVNSFEFDSEGQIRINTQKNISIYLLGQETTKKDFKDSLEIAIRTINILSQDEE